VAAVALDMLAPVLPEVQVVLAVVVQGADLVIVDKDKMVLQTLVVEAAVGVLVGVTPVLAARAWLLFPILHHFLI
jgi:hypothetical protein